MVVFTYIFEIFSEIINVYSNTDFFGLGFSYLQFILGGMLAIALIGFVLKQFGILGNYSLLPFNGSRSDISNAKREQQLSSHDTVDVYGDGTYIMSRKDYFN